MRSRVLYRRSPHLACYWQGRDFVIHNYVEGKLAAVEPLAVVLLHHFESWRSAHELPALQGIPERELEKILASLCELSILERRSGRSSPAQRVARSWDSWNPLAGLFHFGTRKIRIHIEEDDLPTASDEDAPSSPRPAPGKRYAGATSRPLPPVRADGEFPRVLRARRTWRRFSRRSIALSELSTLLGLTWGVQKWATTLNYDRVPLKTSPSGGACHPLEAYVLALKVSGLPRGLYHYVADDHRLELLKRGSSARQVEQYIPGQPAFKSAAALVMMTAVFPRCQSRYSFPRAYRSVLLEAGHFCQTFCLTATWLGLAPFCTMLLDDERVERDLRVDGIDEAFVYAAGVGARERGVDWAP